MKSTLIAAASSLALMFAAAPTLAQTANEPSPAQLTELGETMAGMFTTDPLTDAEQARLPAAQAIIDQMMPEGFYAEMMTEILETSFKPMMSMFSGAAGADLAMGSRLKFDPEITAGLSDDEKIELATMLDPGFAQRGPVMQRMMNDIMIKTATTIEPGFREGMAKAYAVRFESDQLADIGAFFETPTGSVYALENLKLMADPQVMSASMKALPAMMEQFGGMEKQMKAAMEELPPERDVTDLSADERARMAELLDVDASTLEEVVAPPKGSPRDGDASGY